MIDEILAAFAPTGVIVSPAQAAQLARYYELMMQANETMNLTAIKSPQEAIALHFVDSASVLFHGLIPNHARCADVGSGAGLPGLVLAILQPQAQFVLLDALNKRVSFLRETAAVLGLTNVEVRHARAEEAGRERSLREAFDVVLARAVAPLPVLCEYCLPLAEVGGTFIAYKGPNAPLEAQQAARALSLLGGAPPTLLDGRVPGYQHQLVVSHKRRPTPAAYPRKPGTPAKQPLS